MAVLTGSWNLSDLVAACLPPFLGRRFIESVPDMIGESDWGSITVASTGTPTAVAEAAQVIGTEAVQTKVSARSLYVIRWRNANVHLLSS